MPPSSHACHTPPLDDESGPEYERNGLLERLWTLYQNVSMTVASWSDAVCALAKDDGVLKVKFIEHLAITSFDVVLY